MNRYKLAFGLAAGVAFFLFYLGGTRPAGHLSGEAPAMRPMGASVTANNSPSVWSPVLPGAETALPTAATPATLADLEPLLEQIETVLHELSSLQGLLTSSTLPGYAPDPLIEQLYQPRIDNLVQTLERLVRKAEGIALPRTQRFLWEQVLTAGLGSSTGMYALNMLGNNPHDALFEDMLTTLTHSGEDKDARTTLAFSILFPSGNPGLDSASTQAGKAPLPSPRQQRIVQFLEEQFQQEGNPDMLGAYLDIYFALTEEQYRVIPAAQFWQQLETLRSRIATDKYFGFRLQKLKLTDPDADYVGLFRDINTAPLTPEQQRNLLSMLGNTVFVATSPNAAESTSQPLPEPQRQLLLQYMESHLAAPSLQDRYALYEYGSQVQAIELLKNREQVADALYQRIVGSRSLDEQVALLLGAGMAGETLTQKLQQDVPLRQRFDHLLRQPGLTPDVRSLLQEAASVLQGAPPFTPEQPVDEYGNNIYYPQETPQGNGAVPGVAPP